MNIRILAIAAAGVAALVAALVFFAFSSIDAIVKAGIEQYGSEIVGTRVRVGSVKIALQEGKGTIRGLRVANPSGFPSGDAISFGEITLGIDIDSLVSADPIVIDVIRIHDFSATWAIDAKGKNNIRVLQQNANRYVGGGESASGSAAGQPAEGSPTLLMIRKFSTAGGRLSADLSALGGGTLSAKIAPVRLTNLGGAKGLPADEIGATIAGAFVKSVLSAVANTSIQSQLNQLLGKGLEKGLDKVNVEGAKRMLEGILNR